MTIKHTKDEGVSASTILSISAGVAAIAAASYYLFGPKGEEHQKSLKGWMIKMKGEIVDKIEDAKDLTEPVYHSIVDSVAATYATGAKVGKEELEVFKDNLKSQWKEIVKKTKEGSTGKKLMKAGSGRSRKA